MNSYHNSGGVTHPASKAISAPTKSEDRTDLVEELEERTDLDEELEERTDLEEELEERTDAVPADMEELINTTNDRGTTNDNGTNDNSPPDTWGSRIVNWISFIPSALGIVTEHRPHGTVTKRRPLGIVTYYVQSPGGTVVDTETVTEPQVSIYRYPDAVIQCGMYRINRSLATWKEDESGNDGGGGGSNSSDDDDGDDNMEE